MSSVRKLEYVTVDEYLKGEEVAEVRHEYVDGSVYAMVGSTIRHNAIAGALFSLLRARLKGSGCRAFISDIKVRAGNAFYYPDVVVTCAPVEPQAVYLTEPKVIVEVLSESTQARDRLEKWTAYRTLASLQEYVLIAQDEPAVDVYRRTDDGWLEIGLTAGETLELASLDLSIPMAQIYDFDA